MRVEEKAAKMIDGLYQLRREELANGKTTTVDVIDNFLTTADGKTAARLYDIVTGAAMTHNNINIGDKVDLQHRSQVYEVLQIVDGYRGVQVRNANDKTAEPMWIDIAEVERKYD